MDKFDRIMEDWVIPLGILAAVVALVLLISGVIK